MAVWEWEETFVDLKVCGVEADTEEAAREKMKSGDWLYEHTRDYYSLELVKDLHKIDDQ